MLKYVIDASVVLDWLEKELVSESSIKIYTELVEGRFELHAPEFLWLEVINVLVMKKGYNWKEVIEAMESLMASGIVLDRIDVGDYKNIVQIMVDNKLAAYDAQYVFLAKKLETKVIAVDQKMLKMENLVLGPGDAVVTN